MKARIFCADATDFIVYNIQTSIFNLIGVCGITLNLSSNNTEFICFNDIDYFAENGNRLYGFCKECLSERGMFKISKTIITFDDYIRYLENLYVFG